MELCVNLQSFGSLVEIINILTPMSDSAFKLTKFTMHTNPTSMCYVVNIIIPVIIFHATDDRK